MKKIFAIAFLVALSVLTVKAQYTMLINGTPFTMKVDDRTRTAEIIDNDYNPDEHRHPFNDKSRKFDDMKHNDGKVVDIPSEYAAYGRVYKITKIGRCAFADFQNVKVIYIPNTVTEIDEYAFFRCSAEEIKVPATVRSIGKRAFGYCTNLKTLSLPANLDYAGEKLYSESKKVNVIRSIEEEFLAQNDEDGSEDGLSKKKSKNMPVVNVSTSTIDTNIPINPTNNRNTYVVVIANENYENDAMVDFAINDGVSFRDYCKQTLGIPGTNIHLRTDATLNHIINEIDWLEKVDNEDINIIFYYAGHGIPNDKTGATFLLPVDGNSSNSRTGYSLSELYEQFNDLKAQRVIVFLDACFSGTKRDESMISAARGGIKTKANPQDPTGKVIVFSASDGDQTAHSFDEEKHGMFTYFLLEKLQKTKGNVSLGELSEHIYNNVVKQSRLQNSNIQTPTVSSGADYSENWQHIRLR